MVMQSLMKIGEKYKIKINRNEISGNRQVRKRNIKNRSRLLGDKEYISVLPYSLTSFRWRTLPMRFHFC